MTVSIGVYVNKAPTLDEFESIVPYRTCSLASKPKTIRFPAASHTCICIMVEVLQKCKGAWVMIILLHRKIPFVLQVNRATFVRIIDTRSILSDNMNDEWFSPRNVIQVHLPRPDGS
jgi:hypothetical protein